MIKPTIIKKSLEELRQLGFTSIHMVHDEGIFRGGSGVRLLNEKQSTLNSDVSQVIGFDKHGWNSKEYPGALLGTISLIRQTFYDAEWYGRAIKMSNQVKGRNTDFREDVSLAKLHTELKNRTPFLFRTK